MNSFDEVAGRSGNKEFGTPDQCACEIVDTGSGVVCCFPASQGPITHEAGFVRFPMPRFSLRL